MPRRFFDITAQFARWFGRPLKWWERNIIFTIERQRRRGGGIRVQVVDYPGTDSTEVLIGYINWLMSMGPGLDLVIVDRSIKEANELKRRFVRRPIAMASQRRPNALRGITFNILYAHDLNDRKALDLYRYAYPVFLDLPCYIIIYYSCSGTRNPVFPPCVERDISSAPTARCAAVPWKIRLRSRLQCAPYSSFPSLRLRSRHQKDEDRTP